MSFAIGTRVVIVRSPEPTRVGQVATVVSDQFPMSGDHTSPWYWYIEPGTPMQDLDISPLPQYAGIGPVSYPPEFLEPYISDDRNSVEWTEELRKLCGVGELVSA